MRRAEFAKEYVLGTFLVCDFLFVAANWDFAFFSLLSSIISFALTLALHSVQTGGLGVKIATTYHKLLHNNNPEFQFLPNVAVQCS